VGQRGRAIPSYLEPRFAHGLSNRARIANVAPNPRIPSDAFCSWL
jgi:hypothetical protein